MMDDFEALIEERVRYTRISQSVADIANESSSVGTGLYATLDCLCRELRWPIGHVFLQSRRDPTRYADSGIWWLQSDDAYAPFVEASRRTILSQGEGFIGSVVRTGETRWIGPELQTELAVRAEAARTCRLCCGIASPILIKDRVCGVMELFADREHLCEPALVEAISHVGTQIGRLIERKELERELMQATHHEHRRIGEELHDTISQQLAGICMLARSLERKLEDEGNAQATRVKAILECVQEASAQVRMLARGLNPLPVASDGLESALSLLATHTRKDFDLECEFKANGSLDLGDEFLTTELFHIAREATHNAVKHSGAKRIRIRAESSPGRLKLNISDDGCGFDPEARHNHGMGLRTLQHRADLIDAQLTIRSKKGGGTSVTCLLDTSRDVT